MPNLPIAFTPTPSSVSYQVHSATDSANTSSAARHCSSTSNVQGLLERSKNSTARTSRSLKGKVAAFSKNIKTSVSNLGARLFGLSTNKIVAQPVCRELLDQATMQQMHKLQRTGIQSDLAMLSTKEVVQRATKYTGAVARAKQQLLMTGNKPKVMPQATLTRFEILGVHFPQAPKNYAEMMSVIEASVAPNLTESIRKSLKDTNMNDAPQPKMTNKILKVLTNKINNPWGRCILWHKGIQTHVFKQSDFIQESTIGKKGVCFPLVLKWLSSPKISQNDHDFFYKDINTPDGREEVMATAVEYYVHKNNHAVQSYLGDIGMNLDKVYSSTGFKIDFSKDGLYEIGISPAQGDGHALGVQVDDAAKSFRFFDPNSGEYSLPSAIALEAFVQDYLSLAYPRMNKNTSVLQLT
jgi:hypothetical protein